MLREMSNLVCDDVKSRVEIRNVKSHVEFQGTRSPDLFLISEFLVPMKVHLAVCVYIRYVYIYIYIYTYIHIYIYVYMYICKVTPSRQP